MLYFVNHAFDGASFATRSAISDSDWSRLHVHADLIRIARPALEQDVTNWTSSAFPDTTSAAQAGLQAIQRSFALVTFLGTVLAVRGLFRSGMRFRQHPEIALLATAAFTLCFALTTAASHTFGFNRYLTDILPFSLLWWVGSALT